MEKNNLKRDLIELDEPEDLEDTPIEELENPKEEDSLSETGVVSMLSGAISNEWSEIDKVNSYITTLSLEMPELEDVSAILNQIVDEKTIHVGMYQKALDLIGVSPKSDLLNQGEEKANEIVDDSNLELTKENENMKIKVKENKLVEGLEENEDLKQICFLLGKAHDCIMEALDLVESVDADTGYSEETIDDLRYTLEDLEASTSEYDFMGEDDPVQSLLDSME